MSSYFVNGELYSPYLIFLRFDSRFEDTALLQKFGLADYNRVTSISNYARYCILANDDTWTLLADDWYYTLWHKPSTRPTIDEFAKRFELFACSVGDCDHSFDFVYYRKSQLVRKYVVADNDFKGGVCMEDFGKPLPGEPIAFKQTDERRIVLELAASLGINTNYRERDLRLYCSPNAATL